jgi:two-component system, OmpR family, response regulator
MRHVLVVEDDREVSAIIRQFLEGHGFRCTAAYSAAAATAMMAATKFDVLLTDVVLPDGASGVDLVAAARAAGIACVVMSGAVEVIRKHAGDSGFLAKPFRRDDLVEIIETVLRSSGPATG